MKVVSFQTYKTVAFTQQEIYLLLKSFTGWVDPRSVVWTEGLCQWKFPTYSAVPQPTAAPRATYYQYCAIKFCSLRFHINFPCSAFSVMNYFLFNFFLEMWKVQLSILMFQKVKDEARKTRLGKSQDPGQAVSYWFQGHCSRIDKNSHSTDSAV